MAAGRTRAWAGEPRTRPTSTVCRSWWRHEDDRRLRASLRLGYARPARGPQTATHDGTGRRSTYPTPNFVRTIPATPLCGALGHGDQPRRRVEPDHLACIRAVERKVESGADADLQHLALRDGEHALPVRHEGPVPHRKVG